MQRVGTGFQLSLGLATLGGILASAPVLALLVPTQIARLTPTRAATNLAMLTAVGATVALVASVVFGALSDRTASRFGRRRPWIAAGAITTVGGLARLAGAHDFRTLLGTWVLVQVGVSALLTASGASLADAVPEEQRGTASAMVTIAFPLAILIGSILVGKLIAGVVHAYEVTLVLTAAFVVPLLLTYRERPLARAEVERRRLGLFVRQLWIRPSRSPDFTIALISRFLLVLGYYLGAGSFLFLFVERVLRFQEHFPGHSTKEGVAVLMVIGVLLLVPVAVASGKLSDRLHRRKIFVVVASVLIGTGLSLMAVFRSWAVAEIASGLIGAGFGAYLAVDMALITQVLPSLSDCGKDLGIMNITNTLPPAIAPLIAAAFVNGFGQSSPTGYRLLFVIAAALSVCSAVLVRRIASVA